LAEAQRQEYAEQQRHQRHAQHHKGNYDKISDARSRLFEYLEGLKQ
jgi:hypothetical protein